MLELSFQNILEDGIDDKGMQIRDFEKAIHTKKIKAQMEKDRKNGDLYFIDQFTEELDAKSYQYYVDGWRHLDTVVVVGIGSAIVGAKALYESLSHPMHNFDKKYRNGGKRMFFLDNVDPDYAIGLLESLELDTTGFIITSYSGFEPETLAMLGLIRDKIGAENLHDHVIFITNGEEGALHELSLVEGYTEVTIPRQLPEALLTFSAATYLPLCMAGIDIRSIYTGAKRSARSYRLISFQNPAVLLACILYEYAKANDHFDLVFMVNQQRLHSMHPLLELYVSTMLNGQDLGFGFHQFSGGRDLRRNFNRFVSGNGKKIFLINSSKKFQRRAVVRNFFDINEELEYIDGQELGEINFHQEAATHAVLRHFKLPSLQVTHADLMEEGIPELLVFYQYTFLFMSYLFDIDWKNGERVEIGENFVNGLLGRPGFKKEKTAFARLNTIFEKFKMRK